MKPYQWLKAIITVMAAMALSIAILSTGTSCKGGIQLPNLGGLPKEAGFYIKLGNGLGSSWQKLTPDQINWQPSAEYAHYDGIRITDADLQKIALPIKKGTTKIQMAWQMTPSEKASISQAIFLDQTLLRSRIVPMEKEQGKIMVAEQVPGRNLFGDPYTYTVYKENGSIDGWNLNLYADTTMATELPDSKPTEGIQLIELALPTSSTAFLMDSIIGSVYLRF